MMNTVDQYEMQTTSYKVPAFSLSKIMALIGKVNKRCRRLRIPELRLQVTGSETKRQQTTEYKGDPKLTVHGVGGDVYYRDVVYNTVEFTGGRPKLAGWEFAATLEHDLETKLTVLRTSQAFGKELPPRFRKAEPICEHCGLRRTRKDTYVVYNAEKDEFKQVGHQCVADFLGLRDVRYALGLAEMWHDVESIMAGSDDDEMNWREWDNTMKQGPVMPLLEFLAQAVAVVRVRGFVSAAALKAWNEQGGHGCAPETTKSRIMDIFFPPRNSRGQIPPSVQRDIDECVVTEADQARAVVVRDWVQSKNPDDLNDYLHNLYAATANEIMPLRRAGIVASLPSAYSREQEFQAAKAEKQAKEAARGANSAFVGAVGERLEFTATIRFTKGFDTQYGPTVLTVMDDDKGNVLTWWGKGFEMNEGDTVHFKATVKKHDERKGVKQTVVTRAKAI